MLRKFRYLIPAGTFRRLQRSAEALPRSLPLARSCWKFIEVLGQDIITRCELARARARDTGELSENRGEAITRDGKTAGSLRFDGSSSRSMPLASATDITRTANLKLRFAGHFRVPWDDNGPDGARIRLAECGLTAITVSADYFR